jgi:long-chain acyl-CoA synthetase
VSDNLALLLAESAERLGERTALVHEGERLSYAELARRTERLAGALQDRSIGAGDAVALLLPNSAAAIAAYFGALRIGAVVVPLNPLLANAEIEPRLAGSRSRAVVTDPEREPEVRATAARAGADVVVVDLAAAATNPAEPVRDCAPAAGGDTAVILYTSGTTGGPKGAMLTHAGLRANARACVEAFELTDDDVILGSAPFSHVFGMSFLQNATLLAGGTLVLVPRFEAAGALAAMIERGVTVFGGVPTMFVALVEAAAGATELPPLRFAHSGGAPLPVETLHAFEERFGCPVLEGYGLTEISGVATTHRSGAAQKPGSAGVPVPNTELRIVSLDGEVRPPREPGEVQLRGASVIREYRLDGDVVPAVDEDGWLSTGDVGYLDEDGYLFLVDRKKDLIIRGGYNVYPREVEEVLYQHPSVFEAAVVGVPHPTYGEEVVAVVVPRPGADCEPEAVKEFVRERVAAYKYPRHVVVADELPKGPSGKILKRDIDRDALARSLAQQTT